MISLFRAFIFMAFLDILIALIGGAIFGTDLGLYLIFLLILAINVGLYLFSEKLVLLMSGAKPIDELLHGNLLTIVKEVCLRLYVSKPKLYIIQESQANIFAIGRGPGHASLVLTQGIINLLSKEELAVVIAHELTHVKTHDILINMMVASLASVVLFPANIILYRDNPEVEDNRIMKFSLPILKFLIHLSAFIIVVGESHYSEYSADKKAAKIMGSGSLLASALLTIRKSTVSSPMNVYPALASIYISDPFGGGESKTFEQFARQPSIEERTKRLAKF